MASRQIPFVASRDFDTHEVARRNMMLDDVGMVITGYMMGYIQCVRDGLVKKYGKRFQGLVITSSNRAGYNDTVSVTAQAKKNSHHIWRLDPNKKLHAALDVKPVGITLTELYNYCTANCRGEIYLNSAEGIVHIAPVGMEDEHWIQ